MLGKREREAAEGCVVCVLQNDGVGVWGKRKSGKKEGLAE